MAQKRQRGGLCLRVSALAQFHILSSMYPPLTAHRISQTNSPTDCLLCSLNWGTSRRMKNKKKGEAVAVAMMTSWPAPMDAWAPAQPFWF